MLNCVLSTGMFQRNSSRKRRLQAKLAAVEVGLGRSCCGRLEPIGWSVAACNAL